jgi:hypothetical protein
VLGVAGGLIFLVLMRCCCCRPRDEARTLPLGGQTKKTANPQPELGLADMRIDPEDLDNNVNAHSPSVVPIDLGGAGAASAGIRSTRSIDVKLPNMGSNTYDHDSFPKSPKSMSVRSADVSAAYFTPKSSASPKQKTSRVANNYIEASANSGGYPIAVATGEIHSSPSRSVVHRGADLATRGAQICRGADLAARGTQRGPGLSLEGIDISTRSPSGRSAR